ncbi:MULTISPECIES: NADPH-dependent F420 reductase [Pantoea]|uniref:NAD(P)-binding domain-containing protein n=1 Tax=Pantoea brenneri TaxID=472694 RepID=A0A7Y6NDH8_9GAMM|nr:MULTISPECIES: NAD(P)-binding domain-containing protein [Pantoea]MBZ6394507.1 NAD(P)-binding domain-containing protein [Pantoea sp.]MBZ6438751.1 NAD(P)-binding domain-containing protein [Pantoea sp.]NUY41584.1 NAD(P)-binding domain-containing protein [Pantoea brenneri]NUY49084.1 NAD(P)-binding domain-containing protein [Pantoea brenneri]NUY59614.1 NAD(P)-binding domain-containing protein [Pantoea brenneri]
MKIGIIGAGFVGRAIAKLAIQAGHQVMLSNSRDPRTLFSLKPMIGCETGTAAEAARFGQVVVIAVPLTALEQLPAAELQGKTVLDAVNYYPERDGEIEELLTGRISTSERLARLLPNSRITKAFNAIRMTDLETQGVPAGDAHRRAIPLAGDDREGKAIAMALYEAFGFDAVDAGALAEGWRFERATPAYCVALNREQLITTLKETPRP